MSLILMHVTNEVCVIFLAKKKKSEIFYILYVKKSQYRHLWWIRSCLSHFVCDYKQPQGADAEC